MLLSSFKLPHGEEHLFIQISEQIKGQAWPRSLSLNGSKKQLMAHLSSRTLSPGGPTLAGSAAGRIPAKEPKAHKGGHGKCPKREGRGQLSCRVLSWFPKQDFTQGTNKAVTILLLSSQDPPNCLKTSFFYLLFPFLLL